ncbi:CHRD domain-containing protein [Aliifodinibius sp. S!AR15-10]|uniref:CHRD domain-containing protein n=1 Tax=Aliifodinibius sp. S!AR15-10 TaxID=2950437 RepID=UPI002858799F|nr:CHRD domain-containing protein [Aliifodinibius sp. S!AR15-10]MDR8391219.1 CHRD domain-containing protein [Aliifodinibius sp. S!AR15-10]
MLKGNALHVLVVVIALGFSFLIGCGGSQEKADSAASEDTMMTEESMQQPMQEEPMDMAEGQTFQAELSGSNEVPSVETSASGTFTATLVGDSIHVQGKFSGLSSDYVASHIHKAVEGENGGPIITLEPTVGADKLSGSWDASYLLDSAQITALKSDSLYINVHSAEHKSGELRGQLTPSGM